MNKLLKNSAGIAAIIVILIIIVGVSAGGATVLAVRMIVTGEDYLQPFVDWGWISSEDDDEEDEEVAKEITTLEDVSRLSTEARQSNVTQYYGYITSAEMSEIDKSDDYYELYDSIKLEINVFATDKKVVEIVFHIDLNTCLKVMYDMYLDEFTETGDAYDNYEDFEEDWLPFFEQLVESSITSDEELIEYMDIYTDNGVLEMYVTEKGFDSLYENYGIDPDEEDVDTILSSIEEELGVTLKKI